MKRLTGKGRHRKRTTTVVSIGSARFSSLSPGIHDIAVKLDHAGLSLLRRDGYKINGTANATYTAGVKSAIVSASVALIGTRPKSAKKR